MKRATAFLPLLLCVLAVLGVSGPAEAGLNRWTPVFNTGTFGPVHAVALLDAGGSQPETLLAGTDLGVFRSQDGGLTWSPSSAGLPPGGEVRRLAAHQGDPGVYAEVDGDLYASGDFGRTWQRVFEPQDGIGALYFEPNTGTVYLGDGPVLLRSRNRGQTWEPIFTGTNDVTAFTLEDRILDRLFVGTLDGLFRSTDGGATWTEVLDEGITGLAVAPSDPDVVYASTTLHGFFRSEDGGITWRQTDSAQSHLTQLAVDQLRPNVVYAGFRQGHFLLLSRDGGESWRPIDRGRPGTFLIEGVDFQPPRNIYVGTEDRGVLRIVELGWLTRPQRGLPGDFFEWLEFDPHNPARIYASVGSDPSRLIQSRDGGRTWQPFLPQLLEVHDIAFDPTRPGTLYLAGNTVIHRSRNGGQTLETIPLSGVTTLAVPSRNTVLVGGCGIRRSADGGGTWTEVLACNLAPDDEHTRRIVDLRLDPFTPSTVYALALDVQGRTALQITPQLFLSRDAGLTWTLALDGASELAVSRHARGTLYAYRETTGEVMKSVDGGRTWAVLPTDLPGRLDDPRRVTDLEEDQESPGTLYLSLSRGGVLRLVDEGTEWTPLNAGLFRWDALEVLDLVPHPGVPHRLYALTRRGLFDGRFPLP